MDLTEKDAVRNFWDKASCGEELYLKGAPEEKYATQALERYLREPYILEFAQFSSAQGKIGLEIGIGLGADFENFVRAGAKMSGIDLTDRAVQHVNSRLKHAGLQANVSIGDAEQLDFPDGSFDFVYSWGVLHHSPDTQRAITEVFRVLRPGGNARIMIYHSKSLVGYMLWVRYALLKLRPGLSMTEIYSKYLESPGTKAYSIQEARKLFASFSDVTIQTVLTHGDLLSSNAGQRHEGPFLTIARYIWPRSLIKRLLPQCGLFMLIFASKPRA